MRKLKGLFAKREDIFKPRILSFREFCQYVYEPSQRIKTLNLPENQKRDVEGTIRDISSNTSLHE